MSKKQYIEDLESIIDIESRLSTFERDKGYMEGMESGRIDANLNQVFLENKIRMLAEECEEKSVAIMERDKEITSYEGTSIIQEQVIQSLKLQLKRQEGEHERTWEAKEAVIYDKGIKISELESHLKKLSAKHKTLEVNYEGMSARKDAKIRHLEDLRVGLNKRLGYNDKIFKEQESKNKNLSNMVLEQNDWIEELRSKAKIKMVLCGIAAGYIAVDIFFKFVL